MMRLRLPGGVLTSTQARAIAKVARDFGHQAVDLTTRENVQLRELALTDLPAVFEVLRTAGVEHRQTGLDNVRNFVACPLSGIDAAEIIDVRALLDELADGYLGSRDYSNLPRKFNVAVAGCREDCTDARSHDLAYVPATRRNDAGTIKAGFNVLVGGALGGTSPRLATPLDAFVRSDQVAPLFRDPPRLPRSRSSRGPHESAPQVAPRGLGRRALPRRRRGRVRRAAPHRRPRGTHARRRRPPWRAPPARSRHALRRSPRTPRAPARRPPRGPRDARRNLRHGRAPRDHEPERHHPHVAEAQLPALLAAPLLRELSPDPAPVWRGLAVSTGNDYCHYSLIDTKARALELATALEARKFAPREGFRLHMSGCVHACGKHHIADVGLQGANARVGDTVVEAADIFIDGRTGPDARLGHRVQRQVLMTDMVAAIEALATPTLGALAEEAAGA